MKMAVCEARNMCLVSGIRARKPMPLRSLQSLCLATIYAEALTPEVQEVTVFVEKEVNQSEAIRVVSNPV